MDGQALAKVFEFSHLTLTRNLDGLTHEESLRAPEPGGNSLHWVLGHMLFYRNTILKLLNLPPAWDPEKAARYARGSTPLGPDDHPAPLEEIRAALDQSQPILLAALRVCSAEELAASPPAGGDPLVQRLAVLGIHEGYHGGQVSLLRRLLGHQGGIP
jgi:uncharacterized damage-inducible protein DinB